MMLTPKKMTETNTSSVVSMSVKDNTQSLHSMKTLNLFICPHMILDSDDDKRRS